VGWGLKATGGEALPYIHRTAARMTPHCCPHCPHGRVLWLPHGCAVGEDFWILERMDEVRAGVGDAGGGGVGTGGAGAGGAGAGGLALAVLAPGCT